MDGATAGDVNSARPVEAAGAIPEPPGERLVHKDTWFNNIKEETFFSTILWLHPTVAGIIVSAVLGENFLDSHTVSELLCSEETRDAWDAFKSLLFPKFIAVLQGVSFFIALATHILLFNRVGELEKKRAEGIMVVNYQRAGVTISKRGPDLQTSKKLWMYNRTIVSPKASLMSFIFDILFRIILVFLGLKFHYAQIMLLCHHFCFCNMVEAFFSPSLRQNLPGYQNRFHVVIV